MSWVSFFMVLVVLVPTGIILAVTPTLMKRGECFAVTVPSAEYSNPILRGYRRSYTVGVLLITAVGSIASAIALMTASDTFAMMLFVIVVFLLLGAAFLLYIYFRAKVIKLKGEQGWAQSTKGLGAAIVSTSPSPKLPSLWWNLLYIPVIVVTAVLGAVLYPQMSDQIPMHINSAGEVSDYVTKTPLIILFAPGIQAFLAVCIIFSCWSITKSKRDIDPLHPVASAQRAAVFARVWMIFDIVMGLTIAGMMITMPLSFAGIISMADASAVIMVTVGLVLLVCLVLSFKYGQNGARLAHPSESDEVIARDDDAHWKLGIFYFNSEDSALFVPERFGIGWTSNFARPLTWMFMAGLVLLVAALIYFSLQLS